MLRLQLAEPSVAQSREEMQASERLAADPPGGRQLRMLALQLGRKENGDSRRRQRDAVFPFLALCFFQQPADARLGRGLADRLALAVGQGELGHPTLAALHVGDGSLAW